jgi:epidermal growth factor receptor substrate 15
LWTLCDIGEKGHLSKGEFLIALHLIQLVSKQKYPLPITLPDALIQIARRFSSGQNGPRLGSNQNLGQP